MVSKIIEDMREEAANEAVLNRDKEIVAMLLTQGDAPELIHEKLKMPMDLILEVQNELLLERRV